MTKTDKLVDRDVPGMPGVVIFSLSPYENEKTASKHVDTQVVKAAAEHDFIARAAFNGLMADTEYECKTRIGETEEQMHAGPTARFKTLPGANKTTPVDFVVVTGITMPSFTAMIESIKNSISRKTTQSFRNPIPARINTWAILRWRTFSN